MNILLYGSIVITAFYKPWRAPACNFLDLLLVTGMLVPWYWFIFSTQASFQWSLVQVMFSWGHRGFSLHFMKHIGPNISEYAEYRKHLTLPRIFMVSCKKCVCSVPNLQRVSGGLNWFELVVWWCLMFDSGNPWHGLPLCHRGGHQQSHRNMCLWRVKMYHGYQGWRWAAVLQTVFIPTFSDF